MLCRFSVLFAGLIILLALSSIPTHAQETGVGLGIILGEPTGFSFKGWTGPANAIDGALAWSFERGNAFHLHADYLWHNFDVFRTRDRIPLYYGVGARIKSGSDDNGYHYDTRFGLRGVIGVDFFIPRAPLDAFLEIAPIMDLTPATELSFNAGIGFRFFIE